MKKVLLTLLAILPLALLNAQTCEPDQAYADSTGVYPLPSAGISECAVVGEPYEFRFTVAVGDSISVPLLGSTVTLPIDSVVVNSVAGLPAGINYVCDPGSCSFPANSLGCATLTGTPLSSVAPGDYPLTITGTAYFPVFPSTFEITFPGDFFPGEYILRVLANSSEDCGLVSSNEELKEKVSLSVSPNPTAGPFNLNINAGLSGNFHLRVVDFLGKSVHQSTVNLVNGENRIAFDGSAFSNGLYILVLENELGKVSQKVLIQH